MTRYYLAITKHLYFDNIGTLGGHISWIYSHRVDNKLNNPAFGANFRFDLKENGSLMNRIINGVNLMGEIVPGYTDVRSDLTFDSDASKYHKPITKLEFKWKKLLP